LVRVIDKSRIFILLNELLKDSSRSDRELARTMGVSQPTVSRIKKDLIAKGIIQGFTIIPNFYEMGYKLFVFTFVKIKTLLASYEEMQKGEEIVKEWMKKQSNVVFSDYCRGMGIDGFMASLHKSYEDFDKFIKKHNQELGHLINDVQSVIVNLGRAEAIKPFHFKYLVGNLKISEE
jgi:DNA-binding Lrp family transcriptional regulator